MCESHKTKSRSIFNPNTPLICPLSAVRCAARLFVMFILSRNFFARKISTFDIFDGCLGFRAKVDNGTVGQEHSCHDFDLFLGRRFELLRLTASMEVFLKLRLALGALQRNRNTSGLLLLLGAKLESLVQAADMIACELGVQTIY